jgi:hypothetical protein
VKTRQQAALAAPRYHPAPGSLVTMNGCRTGLSYNNITDADHDRHRNAGHINGLRSFKSFSIVQRGGGYGYVDLAKPSKPIRLRRLAASLPGTLDRATVQIFKTVCRGPGKPAFTPQATGSV